MFIKPVEQTVKYLEKRAQDFGAGCKKVYVSLSGGVDSAVVVTILARAFGPENVVAMYRDLRSNPKHLVDVRDLEKAVGFKLRVIDANPMYDEILRQLKEQALAEGDEWFDEGTIDSTANGWESGYASFKSRAAVPIAGLLSKIVDGGAGRIYGTGNAEEDLIFRYYDKFGDGAVDNNILVGLMKVEVRQIAMWFSEVYGAEVFMRIARKTPSADLNANGDAHNDEDELTSWAQNMGFNIRLSYGDLFTEGNIAWIVRQNLDQEVINGCRENFDAESLARVLGYTENQVQLIMFARVIEKATRHKELGIPGVERWELREQGLVD
ncbi:MAG: ammonia-dependent NAD(+) synthetase [Candidatus Moraniibacteriota bacterium]|jgi:NH3-dependent NAD+ synthetase